jgi:drug/metabolite transporter (DMT)-like permease
MESALARRRLTGLALTLGGTLLISPDALVVTLVSRTESPGAILFYKHLWNSVVQWIFCLVYLGGPRKLAGHVRQGGRWAVLGAVLLSTTQTCLNLSFMNTSSANALVLFSMHTAWAAIGGWLFVGDKLPLRTIAMVGVGIASAVAIFIWGGDESDGEGSVLGDVLAATAGITFAGLLLVYRHAATHMPTGTSMLASTCAASTMSACVGLVLAWGDFRLNDGLFSVLILALDGGVLAGGAQLLYTIGPKCVSRSLYTFSVFFIFSEHETTSPSNTKTIASSCRMFRNSMW